MREGRLVLGPFQGKPACIEIEIGKGVCGTAVANDQVMLVKDVHQFPGHIACDSASNSEIVIPLHKGNEIVGVLDIDSPVLARFDEEDQEGLEHFVKILESIFFFFFVLPDSLRSPQLHIHVTFPPDAGENPLFPPAYPGVLKIHKSFHSVMAHYDPDYYHILTKLPILSAKQPGILLFSTLDIFLFCLYIITLAKLFLFGEIKMNELLKKIRLKDASAFTHSGKFHADDVFSSALLLYLNPEITILRGNKVPEDFDGIIFDIGRGRYDHHQKDSRIRENGIPYAAFGLLWEELGTEILGEELAAKFDEAFVQPLDNNDNTGEKNELASLIGSFNPSWDEDGGTDEAFFRAVSVAGMILDNKFARYLGNERADKRIEEILETQNPEADSRILVLPEFIPCQKRLSETDIAFVIFPSNRGGYCIQPQKKEYSLNYKCSFPSEWLGLENEELQKETGLSSASFCHKGGFLMTTATLEDARKACQISLDTFTDEITLVNLSSDTSTDTLLMKLPELTHVKIIHKPLPDLPALDINGIYAEIEMKKTEWKKYIKDLVKDLLKTKPEAVYVDGDMFSLYPIVHQLRKKHIPVLTSVTKNGEKLIIRIPSGS